MKSVGLAYASCPAKESALQQGALAVTLNVFFLSLDFSCLFVG